MADSDDFPIVSKLIYLLNYSIAEFGVLSRGKTRVINYGRIIAGVADELRRDNLQYDSNRSITVIALGIPVCVFNLSPNLSALSN